MKTMQDLYDQYPNMIPDFDPENEIAALLTPDSMPNYDEGGYCANSVETFIKTLMKYAHRKGASVQFIATDKDAPCGEFVTVLMLKPGSEAHYNFVNNIV